MEYRYQQSPGCGGCLFLAGLFALLIGGTPLLFDLLGFIFVAILFFLLAATAAVWAFSYFIKRQIRQYEQSQTEAHNLFVHLLINILVKIAAMDGTISQEEINTINHFFRDQLHYSQSQMLWVREMIKSARQSTATLEELLQAFAGRFAYEPRLLLLELIYRVIYSKTPVGAQELRTAQAIADFLRIPVQDQRTIQSRYTRGMNEEQKYYEILGIESGADFDTIKSAYRRLSVQYHPDKVGHLGEEFRKVAEEKMKEINVAYDYFRRKFKA